MAPRDTVSCDSPPSRSAVIFGVDPIRRIAAARDAPSWGKVRDRQLIPDRSMWTLMLRRRSLKSCRIDRVKQRDRQLGHLLKTRRHFARQRSGHGIEKTNGTERKRLEKTVSAHKQVPTGTASQRSACPAENACAEESKNGPVTTKTKTSAKTSPKPDSNVAVCDRVNESFTN